MLIIIAISKGDNKTGLVMFLFEGGALAEKNRTAILDANVTLSSLNETAGEKFGLEQRNFESYI